MSYFYFTSRAWCIFKHVNCSVLVLD